MTTEMETETVKFPVPLAKRLLVKRRETETTTEGGIVLPDSAQNKPQTGRVLAIGCDVTSLRRGEEILFQNLGLIETEIAGESILIMEEEDVLIVFREKKEEPPCMTLGGKGRWVDAEWVPAPIVDTTDDS